MPEWQGKSKGTPLGYKIFVFILRRLGVVPAYILLRFVALYYFLFSWSASRPIYYYFRRRLGYSWLKSIINIYRNFYVLGQTLIDKVMVMAQLGNQFTFKFDGEENIHNMVT